MILKEDTYPIADGLSNLFPTLIGKGMKYYQLAQDDQNGQVQRSDTPLRVSIESRNFRISLKIFVLYFSSLAY